MSVAYHIGFPKTASTWLQKVAFPAHSEIHLLGPNECVPLLSTHDARFNPEPMIKLTQSAKESVSLFSSEDLIGSIFAGGLDTLRNIERMKAISSEAKVILIIRCQTSLIKSLYRQFLREGGTLKFNDFIRIAWPSPLRVDLSCFDYYRLYKLFTNHFGKERFRIFLFEDLAKDPLQFANHLFEFLELKPICEDALISTKAVNSGVRAEVAHIQRFLNQFAPSHLNNQPVLKIWSHQKVKRIVRRRIQPLIPVIPDFLKWNGISSSDLDFLHETFAPSNTKLQMALDVNLREYGYPV